jgi:hypothetical protein
MESKALIDAWRSIINGPRKSWVLFANGTCVVLMQPEGDLAAQATALLREWGPVGAGSSFGDFGTVELDGGAGWVVTCHHNDVLTYVGPDEVGAETASDLAVGLLGRSKRGRDAEELRVLHVEDRRGA